MVVCNAASVAQSLFRVDRAARRTPFPYPISTIREWISALSIYPFIEPFCCDFSISLLRSISSRRKGEFNDDPKRRRDRIICENYERN